MNRYRVTTRRLPHGRVEFRTRNDRGQTVSTVVMTTERARHMGLIRR